jgi:hypothetical protein
LPLRRNEDDFLVLYGMMEKCFDECIWLYVALLIVMTSYLRAELYEVSHEIENEIEIGLRAGDYCTSIFWSTCTEFGWR